MKRKKLKLFDKYPTALPKNVLPTYEDVVRAIHETKNKYSGKGYKEAIHEVIYKLMEIWVEGASLPIVNIKTISDKVFDYHAKYLKLAKAKPQGKKYKTASDFIMVSILTSCYAKM